MKAVGWYGTKDMRIEIVSEQKFSTYAKEEDMVVTHEKRAFGVFSNRQKAEQALNELKASGFSMEQVSIIAKDADQGEQISGAEVTDRIANKNVGGATGIVKEVATDSALGGVLVGLGSLAIPGIGPVIAAGSLATALVATAASTGIETAAIGGVVRALADLGIPEEQARLYSDHLYRGHYLVIVDGTEDDISGAEAIFNKQGIQGWGVYNPSQA